MYIHICTHSTQHTATQLTPPQLPAPHCNTLPNAATHLLPHPLRCIDKTLGNYKIHCDKLQQATHTATSCNTQQQAATCCNKLKQTATHLLPRPPRFLDNVRRDCKHTATHCNTLQHTATRCNTPAPTHAVLFRLGPQNLQHRVEGMRIVV